MADVYLGLGSNLGNRRANLQMALRGLTRMSRLGDISSLYETQPVPPAADDQPPYYNAACRIDTGLEPAPLLRFLQTLEREIGRRPSAAPGDARVIDLDILLYEDRVVESSALKVPHPRLHERAFVLTPLAEIAPEITHPATGETVSALAAAAGASGIVRIVDSAWPGIVPGTRIRI